MRIDKLIAEYMLKKLLNLIFIKNQKAPDLQRIIDVLPGHIYWYDKEGFFRGCNDQQAKSLGFRKSQDLIGKNFYEMQAPKIVEQIKKNNNLIYETGEMQTVKEPGFYNNSEQIFLSKKMPWFDKNKEIIGILGVSFDITEEIKLKKELEIAKNQTENVLRNIINIMPGHVYWKDLKFKFRGCNQKQAESAGFKSPDQLIGKDDFEMPWKDDAAILRRSDEEVIKNKSIFIEEPSMINGKEHTFLSQKVPLKDGNENIIGILGVSFDITDRKDKERLEIENEQNVKFREILDQFVHDIQSPVASIDKMSKTFPLPEKERLDLREAARRINGMSRNLLNKYKTKDSTEIVEEAEPVLISVHLLNILNEKGYQYKDKDVRFEEAIKNYFVFVDIEPEAFTRMISNLINNAVDALENNPKGWVKLGLKATKTKVSITIEDNGKGMPPELVAKIMNKIAVTHGKADGHGIGLTQVQQTLERNDGELTIESEPGKGTKMMLTFPRTAAPAWVCEEIVLGPEDIIVVLDDEDSVKDAWQAHFKIALKDSPDIKVHYFKIAQEAISFIEGLAPLEQGKVMLLTDYELLDQALNGLDVVKKTQVHRSVLVTSHHGNKEIRAEAMKTGTKILPKQLASEIPIVIDAMMQYIAAHVGELKQVDLIIVDDDERYVRNMKDSVLIDLTVDHYTSPEHFLTIVRQYPKDTKICLDLNFNHSRMNGFYLAEQLNKLGYTRLFMISGEEFGRRKLPPYLTILNKYRIEEIKNY